MSNFIFPEETPGWLRAWCELNGYDCAMSDTDYADSYYIFKHNDGFTINKNIDVLVFLKVYGDRNV